METMETSSPKKKGRPPFSDAEKKALSAKVKRENGGLGVNILGNAPITAPDLIAAWGIGVNDQTSTGVIIQKQVEGFQRREVIARVPVRDYDLVSIMRECGPGTYYAKGAPGAYQNKVSLINVSEFMARQAGWGKMPEQPQAADILAVRTLQQVGNQSGVDAVQLQQAIVQATERTVEAIMTKYGIKPGVQQQNPMDQFQQMQIMMNFMKSIRADAMEDVKMSLGIAKPEPEEKELDTMGILGKVAAGFAEAWMNRPQPAQPQPLPYAQPVAAPVVANPTRKEPPAIYALMSEDEKSKILPALGMLNPWKSVLVELGQDHKKTEPEIAAELAGYIPDALADSMVALAGLAERHGVMTMALLDHPGLQTGRWVTILLELRRELRAKYEGEL